MKAHFFIALISLTSITVTSCGSDDEDKVDPLVGNWIMDDVTISDPPEGYVIATSDVTFNTYYGEQDYTITFFTDLKYEREINFGATSWKDNGTWTKKDTDLDLTAETKSIDGLPTVFTISQVTAESLVLVTQDLWFAWPPEIVNDPQALDTLESNEINDFFDEYGAVVNMKFTMDFDKQ